MSVGCTPASTSHHIVIAPTSLLNTHVSRAAQSKLKGEDVYHIVNSLLEEDAYTLVSELRTTQARREMELFQEREQFVQDQRTVRVVVALRVNPCPLVRFGKERGSSPCSLWKRARFQLEALLCVQPTCPRQ